MKVLLHIQSNLDKKPNLEELAQIAFFSPFHFHRIFKAFTGESIFKYIRRLKLERAASELKYSDKLINLIAIKAGYENTESFSRVFKTQFKKSPMEFRKHSKKELENSIGHLSKPRKPKELNIELIDITNTKHLICLRHIGNYNDVGQTWDSLKKWVYKNQYKIKSTLGISYDNPKITEEDKIRYDACVELEKNVDLGSKMHRKKIRNGKYAVVTIKGEYESLNTAYEYFYVKWLEKNRFELRNEPSFEVYKNMTPDISPENYITEIYFPII